jgi:hypothetical protein
MRSDFLPMALTGVEQQRAAPSSDGHSGPRLPSGDGAAPFYVPLPFNVIFCTLLRAESLIDKTPVRVPVAVGEKVTLMVQLLPTVSLAGQLLVSE